MDKVVYDWQYRVVEAIYKLDAEETERAVFLLRNHTRKKMSGCKVVTPTSLIYNTQLLV
jgi:hypothetical protein